MKLGSEEFISVRVDPRTVGQDWLSKWAIDRIEECFLLGDKFVPSTNQWVALAIKFKNCGSTIKSNVTTTLKGAFTLRADEYWGMTDDGYHVFWWD